MTALCSRVDCGEPAVAVFGFDALASLVWLDPLEGRAAGAGMLCAAHADTFTPIRGWTLQDRRMRAPRLWADRPRPAPPTRRPRRPPDATRGRHHPVGEATVPLPFGADDAPDADDGPTDFDRLLDARTPLLTRAFQAARGRES
jgi:hypothetical protein